MVTAEEHTQVLAEELEVLESIYPDELEDPILSLEIKYSDEYPDTVPEMYVRVEQDDEQVLGPSPEGSSEDMGSETGTSLRNDPRQGVQVLRKELAQIAEESLGMPMVFTLASHLREALTAYIRDQAKRAEEHASQQREAEIAAEEEKFRGTAVTVERFMEWRKKYLAEQQVRREKAEAEKMAAMSNKEREEYKRYKSKPTGRELFTRQGAVDDDEEKDLDESVKEVDWDLYNRDAREKQARDTLENSEDQDGILLNDSDNDS
ncbi:Protein gir2 [Malassezia psittaci]|uniref:Protein gir2 n=1 Tax=Malassezia psittaci TaxID=1821823 RepID=A0AAF0FCU9_9BASI|nr:Protein gir2 [Malassezia psittaci]